MDHGTCAQCRFWVNGFCDRLTVNEVWLAPDLPGDEAELRFIVLDDSGLDIRLATGPDFFCPHFIFDPARNYRKRS